MHRDTVSATQRSIDRVQCTPLVCSSRLTVSVYTYTFRSSDLFQLSRGSYDGTGPVEFGSMQLSASCVMSRVHSVHCINVFQPIDKNITGLEMLYMTPMGLPRQYAMHGNGA